MKSGRTGLCPAGIEVMLLDSNILIYVANEQTPELEAMVTSAENAVASVVQIEVYGLRPVKN